jgi:plasmid stabilization system protein ParE
VSQAYRLTERAEADVQAIADFIAADSIDAAVKVVVALEDAFVLHVRAESAPPKDDSQHRQYAPDEVADVDPASPGIRVQRVRQTIGTEHNSKVHLIRGVPGISSRLHPER